MNGSNLAYLALTAVAVTLINIGYIKYYQLIHDFFKNWSWKGQEWLEPAAGMAIAAAIIAPIYPLMVSLGIVGGGSSRIFSAQNMQAMALAAVILGIFFATALISGTGSSGGLFMPILIMGSLLGLLLAAVTGFPYPILLAMVGISASLSTTLNVPIAAAVIVVELFGPPALVPAIIGALAGYVIGRNFVIYQEISWKELN